MGGMFGVEGEQGIKSLCSPQKKKKNTLLLFNDLPSLRLQDSLPKKSIVKGSYVFPQEIHFSYFTSFLLS
jgi:hypothetical protein